MKSLEGICWGDLRQAGFGPNHSQLLVFTSTTTSFLMLWIIFLVSGFKITKNGWGFTYDVLPGIAGEIASIFFYMAPRQGKASALVPLTALYPLVTVALSVLFLQEEISGVKVIGIILALVASLLLSF